MATGPAVSSLYSDQAGNFTLSSNISVCEAALSLIPDQYVIYITGGNYYAESANTVTLLGETGINRANNATFITLSFDEKIAFISENFACNMEAFSSAQNPLLAIDLTLSARYLIPSITVVGCNITNFVSQGSYNLCWAATVATIANYKQNLSLTAFNIADRYDINYNAGVTRDFMYRVLRDYNMSNTVYAGCPSWSTIVSLLENDNPFIIDLIDVDDDHVGHYITGYSCSYPSSTASLNESERYITAWDSNGSHVEFQYDCETITTSGYEFYWNLTVLPYS